MRLSKLFRRRAGDGAAGIPDGLWSDDFQRVDRACRRFVQVSADREDMTEVRAVLEDVRGLAWQQCVQRAEQDPRAGVREVPADEAAALLHRALGKAANRCAQAAQAVVMGEQEADGGVAAARRAAEQARELLVARE